MSIFSKFKLWGKKKDLPPPILPKETLRIPATPESAGMENLKAKIDLVLTQIDSLRVQNETLNERMRNMERSIAEILTIAKS